MTVVEGGRGRDGGPGPVSDYTTHRNPLPQACKMQLWNSLLFPNCRLSSSFVECKGGDPSFFFFKYIIFFFFLVLFNESFGILSVPVPDVWLAGEHENSWKECLEENTLSFKKKSMREIVELVDVGSGMCRDISSE